MVEKNCNILKKPVIKKRVSPTFYYLKPPTLGFKIGPPVAKMSVSSYRLQTFGYTTITACFS